MRGFETYSQKRKAALRRRKIVCALCAAVALGVGWVLMRPAITLTDQPECGREEHTHSDACYSLETGPAPLLCTQEEHEHGDNCYDAEGNLLCQQQAHIHAEGCYGEPVCYPVLTCTVPEHAHSDECYPIPEPTPAYTVGPVLECGMAEHVHGEGCYNGEDLVCTIPQHTHSDSCRPQPETEPQPEQTQPEEEPQEPEAPEEAAWENLTEAEKRQALFTALHIETEEDAAAFDALLATYEKTLDDIRSLLLEQEAAGEPIETLAALQACLEAQTAPEETTESTEPTEEPLSPLEELRQRLGIESEEDAAALDGLLETYGKTPEDVLSQLEPEAAISGVTELEVLLRKADLSEEARANIAEIESRLQIQNAEEKLALLELLEKYSLEPAEILEYLTCWAEDPEMEQITDLAGLKALIESAYDVSVLAVEDGVFRKEDALSSSSDYVARKIVDGKHFTARVGYYASEIEGWSLSVKENEVSAGDVEYASMHGVVHNLKSYTVQVEKDGAVYTSANMPHLTVSDLNGEIYVGRRTLSTSSALGTTGETKPLIIIGYEKLSTAESILMSSGQPIDVVAYDSIQYTSQYKGRYEISYILKNYNVFVENDYEGTHVVGPMIVGGTASRSAASGGGSPSLGGLSTALTTAEHYGGAPHQVPSYFGSTSATEIITGNASIPVYLKKDKGNPMSMAVTYWDEAQGSVVTTPNYIYTADEYIDFAGVKSAVSGEIAALQSASTAATLGEGNGDTYDCTLPAGGVYQFTADAFAKNRKLYLTGDTDTKDTSIIITDSGTDTSPVYIPTIVDASGMEMGNTAESGRSTGVVFMYPGTRPVQGHEVTGHLVAPNADVTYTGGNYNGCVIAESLSAPYAEGHMWPYKGQSLTPPEPIQNEVQVSACKQLNGENITDTSLKFNFSLYRRDVDESGNSVYTAKVAAATNDGSNVVFKFGLSTGGDYVYKMVEDCDEAQRAAHPGVLFDARAFYVKVHVDENLKATATYYSDEACTNELGGNQVPTFNNRYGEKLPDTGGPGVTVYILPGVFLMALALAGACISRKRRAA